MSEKKYIGGSAKAITTQYGEILNLSLKLSDLQSIVNEKGYVNITVSKRKELGQYGDTHSVTENTYKKETPVEQAKKFGDDFGGKVGIESVPF